MKERNGLYERTETFLFTTHWKDNIHRKCKAVRKCKKPLNRLFQNICKHEVLGGFFTDKSFNLENPQKVSCQTRPGRRRLPGGRSMAGRRQIVAGQWHPVKMIKPASRRIHSPGSGLIIFYSVQLTYLRVLPLMTISSITVPMMIRPRMMDCQFALIPIILIPL